MYTTPTEVIRFTGVKPTDFRGVTDETDLNDLINDWILHADNLINSYCHRTFDTDYEYYPAISNICLRLTANIIALAQSRKDTPVIRHDNWSIQAWISSDVFTDDLKNDLEQIVVEKSNVSDRVDLVAITGETIDKTLW